MNSHPRQRLDNLRQILRYCSHHQNPINAPHHDMSSPSPVAVSAQASMSTDSDNPGRPCRLSVSPAVSQFDQKVQICVSGLTPHVKVTVQGWACSRWRQKHLVLVSHGHFIVNQQGSLDLNQHASFGGTYTGVDPMGLFWSMAPLPGSAKDVRLLLRDVTKPLVVNFAVFSGHITPDDDTMAMTSLKPLSVTSVQRHILAPGVKRIEVKEGRIRGTLFLPEGDGPHPGVIDMFGASGGLTEIRAALFASRGLAALALAFFKFDDLPERMDLVQFQYFESIPEPLTREYPQNHPCANIEAIWDEEAAVWLSRHPAVRPGGVGVVGVSSGAANALLMAANCPQVKAVVEINGPPFQIVSDFLRNDEVFKPAVKQDETKVILLEEGYMTKDIYYPEDKEYFQAWRHGARVLCLQCEDDQQVATRHTLRLRDLYPQKQRHLIDVVIYPGGGHLLEPPFTPHCRYCFNPVAAANVMWGGHPKEHATAQWDAWHRTISFLHTWLS